ncbi:MAG: glycosyltransferase [Bradyrhizobium sp.]|uniref:glycosyltransferase n=1 Tax=Bradyrhizobium sp. TaxID=376 RepID=UPI0011F715C4|nr:glycosyltransferase [Bradyrhizobium sp.]THD73082.1 MAG: glycosyltransferase [Bradyrhizobium sp.]
MRLLLTTYHQAFLAPGGGETEFLQLAEYLSENGVRADFYGHTSRPLRQYDAVIHFSAFGGGEGLLRSIRDAGKPIVLLPNYNFFNAASTSAQVVREHLDLADLIVVRTHVESELCKASFHVDDRKLVIVPPGINPSFAKLVPDDLFRSAYGLERFILWVGALEQAKQQLQAIEALNDYDIPLIFIGGYRDRSYFEKCKAAASNHVRFLPYLQAGSEIVRSAMQSCEVYLELGVDFPGHSAIEAGLAGAPLVLHEHPWSRELLGDDVTYIAADNSDIGEGVSRALAGKKRNLLVNRIKQQLVQPESTARLIQEIELLLERWPGRK